MYYVYSAPPMASARQKAKHLHASVTLKPEFPARSFQEEMFAFSYQALEDFKACINQRSFIQACNSALTKWRRYGLNLPPGILHKLPPYINYYFHKLTTSSLLR